MKLYRINYATGDHGVSVFPSHTQELPAIDVTKATPWGDIHYLLRGKGYGWEEAEAMMSAWAWYAQETLRLEFARYVDFVRRCAIAIEPKLVQPPPLPVFWGVVAGVAFITAVALGLYLWAVLDTETDIALGGCCGAYLMTYGQRIWKAELFNVGHNQVGVYEQCSAMVALFAERAKNIRGFPRVDWMGLSPGGEVIEGRRTIFYHIYRVTSFRVYYCGLLSNWGNGLYKLRKGGSDPELPRGPWTRSGGRYGASNYQGCWQEFWWF